MSQLYCNEHGSFTRMLHVVPSLTEDPFVLGMNNSNL